MDPNGPNVDLQLKEWMAKHLIKQTFYRFYTMKMPVINFIAEQINAR